MNNKNVNKIKCYYSAVKIGLSSYQFGIFIQPERSAVEIIVQTRRCLFRLRSTPVKLTGCYVQSETAGFQFNCNYDVIWVK